MRFAKKLLFSALTLVALAGAANTARADYWRNHDGHWSYFHEGDKCWYYTDGTHWFCENAGHWLLYRFDKKFGHENFEMGGYKVPHERVKVVVPEHRVFHHEER